MHVANRAVAHEVARGEACQLTLAVCQRYRRGFSQQREIRRLQIPVQRLFQPKDVVRRNRACELDTCGQVVRGIHVEHQRNVRANGCARGGNARDFILDRAGASLEFDRCVTARDEAGEFVCARREFCAFNVVTAGAIGKHRFVLRAEQLVHRHAGSFTLNVPQRHVDAADGRHDLRTRPARQTARAGVLPGRGECEKFLPHSHMRQRIHADNVWRELHYPRGDVLHRRAAHLAVSFDAVAGDDFDQQQRHVVARLVRGVVPVFQGCCDRIGVDYGNFVHGGCYGAFLAPMNSMNSFTVGICLMRYCESAALPM